ncbi:glycosyltransferase family 2 protein [Frondihabitans peucedani]|uniref:GT2 family glycosyltransferase n=1 Tax=Frondihabitans peucedani TaxID=598626 RepID=A0ABP8DZH8_9MICO
MTVAGGHTSEEPHLTVTSARSGARRPVSIVVPIYDDLDGLLACLQSLIEHVDFDVDRVVLANDAGPNADVIEEAVLKQVDGHDGFEYHRNKTNLGFLGNCNNVVLNLDHTGNDVMLLNSDTVVTAGFIDEMSAVLYESESHGVVAPRSNNATIATIPFLRRNVHAPTTLARTSAVHAVVAPLLPRYTVAPVAMGFCFLIRRELIDRFGLFDERFAPGYGEENDFCLRINEHGFASLLANRALVFHTGSTSFSGDRGPSLRFAHEKVLIER